MQFMDEVFYKATEETFQRLVGTCEKWLSDNYLEMTPEDLNWYIPYQKIILKNDDGKVVARWSYHNAIVKLFKERRF